MEKQENIKAENVVHCPVCNANAVQPCQQPQTNDCPRGEDRK